jgi:hypothetical protein
MYCVTNSATYDPRLWAASYGKGCASTLVLILYLRAPYEIPRKASGQTFKG